MQDWNMEDVFVGLENAELENAGLENWSTFKGGSSKAVSLTRRESSVRNAKNSSKQHV